MRATYPAHLIIDFIILVIHGKKYKFTELLAMQYGVPHAPVKQS
jgi:hypothetical protein